MSIYNSWGSKPDDDFPFALPSDEEQEKRAQKFRLERIARLEHDNAQLNREIFKLRDLLGRTRKFIGIHQAGYRLLEEIDETLGINNL